MVAHQALCDIARHIGALPVLALVRTGNALESAVLDAGVGIRPVGRAWEGAGLVSMGERVRLLAGELHVIPAPSPGSG